MTRRTSVTVNILTEVQPVENILCPLLLSLYTNRSFTETQTVFSKLEVLGIAG